MNVWIVGFIFLIVGIFIGMLMSALMPVSETFVADTPDDEERLNFIEEKEATLSVVGVDGQGYWGVVIADRVVGFTSPKLRNAIDSAMEVANG